MTDLRDALRTLRRSPGFAASAIAALALGIGANTAVFSVVYAVLLKPLPYADSARLVSLSEVNAAEGWDPQLVSRGTFNDWQARARTVESVAAYTSGGESLWAVGDRPQAVRIAAASASLTRVLSVQPIFGIWFPEQPAPYGAVPPVVIGYGLWQRLFGGAPDVVGRRVLVEGRTTREIVGVMPRGFAFPEKAEAWVPLSLGGPTASAQRRFVGYRAIGRAATGMDITAVQREMDGLSAQIAVEHPATNAGWTARVVSLAGSDTATVKPALLTLVAAVGGVLLIGCANVANLLLARGTARRREMGIRVALGARTSALVRQCLTEALVLALIGTTAGIVLGSWLCGILVGLAPPDVPRLADVGMNGVVFLFAAAAGLLSTVLVGVVPAVQAARAARRGTLRPEARAVTTRAAFARRMLIGGEVAIVVLLLTGALLLLRTFVSLSHVDLGFDSGKVWAVSTRWPLGRFAPATPGARMWPRLQRGVDGLVASVAAIPGVDAVGLIADVPLAGGGSFSNTLWRADAPGAAGLTPPTDPLDRWKADLNVVTPGYFPALGIPIVRGRNFAETDRWTDAQLTASDVPMGGAIIANQAFASKYFPGQDPVGRTLVIHDDQTFGWSRTIVGVVADVRGHEVAEAAAPTLFVPHAQHPDVFLPSLMVRTSLPPGAIAAALRDRIRAYDPQLLVQRIRPMDDVVSGALSGPRFNLVLVGSFAAVALLLAAVGIYGVVSFMVAQRTREIGIRMALGARATDLRGLVLRDGMAPVAAGAVCGLLASLIAARAMKALLFGVTPSDPVSLAAAPALLALVALVACAVPARRAVAVDPIVALRED